MLSIRLNEKWQAIIATAGAARRSTTGRSGPTVRDPAPGGVGGAADAISGGLGAVPRYQHERVVRAFRSEEHTSELQSLTNLVCRLLLEKKNRRRTSCRRWLSLCL